MVYVNWMFSAVAFESVFEEAHESEKGNVFLTTFDVSMFV